MVASRWAATVPSSLWAMAMKGVKPGVFSAIRNIFVLWKKSLHSICGSSSLLDMMLTVRFIGVELYLANTKIQQTIATSKKIDFMRHKNLLMCYFSLEKSVNPTPVQYYSYSLL